MNASIARILKNEGFVFSFVALAVLLLSFRILNYIDDFAVNILYWDQWDFNQGLFSDYSLTDLFLQQHGPHRQGLGALVIKLVSNLTNWSSRAESFTIGIILIIAGLSALFLTKMWNGRLKAQDLAVFIPFVGLGSFEALVLTPNPAHGALPVLLVFLIAFSFLIKRVLLRYSSLLLLNFLLIFTGFGLFSGVVLPAIIGVSIIRAWRWEKSAVWIHVGALVFAIFSLVLFFVNYKHNPAITCFKFPDNQPYLEFMSIQYATAFGNKGVSLRTLAFGGAVLFSVVFSCVKILVPAISKKIWPEESLGLPVLFMLAFGFVFVLNTSIGRACGGVGTAQASRYVLLLYPTIFALYNCASFFLTGRPRQVATVLLLLLLVRGEFLIKDKQARSILPQIEQKRAWKTCYVEFEDIQKCEAVSQFQIYPAPAATNLKEKLDFLKQNNLNLFNGDN